MAPTSLNAGVSLATSAVSCAWAPLLMGSSVHYSRGNSLIVPNSRTQHCAIRITAAAAPLRAQAACEQLAYTDHANNKQQQPRLEGDKRIKDIVILGGGTAGWMAAAYLAKALQGTANITVLESPEIPKLGVGEATIPNLQTAFFDFLEIPEEEWMRECNASYKMAIKFINWRTPGEGSSQPRMLDNRTDHFYHIFGQLPYHDQLPLSHYWFQKLRKGETDLPFDYACYHEPLAMDLNKAPRRMDGTSSSSYAWHFDAHLVADYLRRHATGKLGVRHIQDRMVRAELKPSNGHIHALHTASGHKLCADLFVDCSGFRGLLINSALEEPFLDMSNHLLCNSAVASAVPNDDASHGVEPFTSAIAMKSGWTWKIPMLGRFGTGYVYSSQFCSPDEAAEDFCRLWGLNQDTARLNKIRFRVGRNRRAWVGNCVSIGTASCFLEPLESTGIYFIYAALYQLVQHFPDRDFQPGLTNHFNSQIETMFDNTRDFIQAHFCFSPRADTPFWRACKELPMGASMEEKLAEYRAGLAINAPPTDDAHAYYSNFEQEFHNFWTNSNYYCVLAGLGLLPDAPLPRLNHMPASVRSAERTFQRVQQRQKELVLTLPSCYDYLRKVHGHQKVQVKV